MSVHHGTETVSLERLGPRDLVEVFGFLDRDPVLNVYLTALVLRDSLAQVRDEFWAARRGSTLVGLLHLGGPSGSLLPLTNDPEAARRMSDLAYERLSFMPPRFQVIGPRAVVGDFTDRLRRAGLAPRLFRNQTYMALARPAFPLFERVPDLRAARGEDYEMVYESGARLRAEELEEDPRNADAAAYARRVQEECRDGYTSVWLDGEGLCFRASVSARTPDAVQISGVYTPPERRNRGFARRGVSELCTRLFEHSRHACLFVNDFNAPAFAVYRRIGFREIAEWASAFYDLGRGERSASR